MSTPSIKDIRAAAAARRDRRQRNRWLLIGAAGVLLLVSLLSWLVLPPVVRVQLEQRGSELLARPVTVEAVRVNPFTLTLTIDGLRVEDLDGESLLAWQRLVVNANLWATVTGSWAADGVELTGLRGRLIMGPTGELNIADLMAKFSGGEGESRPLEVRRLMVTDTQIKLADESRTRPFATTLGPLSFSLTDFHTKYDPEAPYQFKASTESGETLHWRGTLSLVPLHSVGDFVLTGIELPKYEAYFAEEVGFEIDSGLLSASGGYEVAWTEGQPAVALSGGEAAITRLVLNAREGHHGQQSFARVEAKGIDADLTARRVTVDEIVVADGSVDLRRRPAGVDWMGVPLAAVDEEAPSPGEGNELAQDVRVHRISAQQIRYRMRDETLVEPATLGVIIDAATFENVIVTDLTSPIDLEVAATFPLGGTLALSGQVQVEPLRPHLEVTLDELDLIAGANHVRELLGLELASGLVRAQGTLSGGEAGLGFAGDIDVSEFTLLEGDGAPLLGLRAGQARGVEGRINPVGLTVETLRLEGPAAHVRIAADGSVNVVALADRWSATTETEAVAKAAAAEQPDLRLDGIDVQDGSLTLRDESLPSVATVSLDAVSGTLSGWTSQDVARAEVELSGQVNGIAPVVISGDLNPLGRPAYADLTVKVDRVDLRPTGGYISKYAGYTLEQGRLSLDIAFQLRDRAIESETLTVLNDFTLGSKTDSPDATNLPVKLGIALLQDATGEIVIDVPVAGHLDDPEFRVGRVVWRVIGNLLTKVATSPFALLGAAVGGADELDLEHHAFDPGDVTWPTTTMESLTAVAKALNQRPRLTLGIRGEYDAVRDAAALQPTVLEQALRSRAKAGDLTTDGGWQPLARESALVALFEEIFGAPPVDPAGTVPPPVAATSPAPDSPAVDPAPSQQTLMAWLRGLFRASESSDGSTEPANGPVSPGEIPLPEGVEPVLAALPIAEIEERLMTEIEVPVAILADLAQRRAAVARDFLVTAGLAAERITVMEATAGAAQVTLDLR